MFRESYTAYMDRAVSPLLASIGLNFEARNYAMGGTGMLVLFGTNGSHCFHRQGTFNKPIAHAHFYSLLLCF
jgi:hypothetical protein